jgi:hypothetical protein
MICINDKFDAALVVERLDQFAERGFKVGKSSFALELSFLSGIEGAIAVIWTISR